MIKVKIDKKNLTRLYKLAIVIILCFMIKVDPKNQVEYVKMLAGSVTAFAIDSGKNQVKKKKKLPAAEIPEENKS
jgi:hypothetical protein